MGKFLFIIVLSAILYSSLYRIKKQQINPYFKADLVKCPDKDGFYTIKLKDGIIYFKGAFPFSVPFADMKSMEIKDEISLLKTVETQKSVLWRGLFGGLLLGPVGAILGGMSGMGTKTIQSRDYHLCAHFVLNDGTEYSFHVPFLQCTPAYNFLEVFNKLKQSSIAESSVS